MKYKEGMACAGGSNLLAQVVALACCTFVTQRAGD